MADTYTVKVDVSDEGVQGHLIYCLLADVIVVEDECVPVYGASVAFKHGGRVELERVHNITTARDEMLELIKLMAQELVFPSSLKDIAEDFIA